MRTKDSAEQINAPRSGVAATEARRAISAIQQLHALPATLPQLALTTGRGDRVSRRYQLDDGGVSLCELRVCREAPAKTAHVIRCIGELLDTQVLGEGASAAKRRHPHLAGWDKAVTATETVSCLHELAPVSEQHAAAADPSALFSRSYAQWVMTSSDDQELRSEFEKTRSRRPELWWSDNEFAPVASAFAHLARRNGWAQ